MDGAASKVEDLAVFNRAYRISLDVHRKSLDIPDVGQRALADQIRWVPGIFRDRQEAAGLEQSREEQDLISDLCPLFSNTGSGAFRKPVKACCEACWRYRKC